jgi:hypothetical protein
MDGAHFDTLARSLATAGSRRRAITGLISGALGLFGVLADETAAKNCKKIRNKKKRKKCLAKAKCVPRCAGKVCGPDGCGGSCGSCAGNEGCHGGTCICVPHCGGNDCGDDGCGGSCGTCSGGRTCQSGQCTCPADQAFCGGTCKLGCEAGQSHHPITCNCCKDNGIPCAAPGPDNTCCSGNCVDFGDSIYGCFVKDDGQECDFNAQCASGICEPDPCTTDLCAIEKYCQPA